MICDKGGTLITFMEAWIGVIHVTHIDLAASLDLATSLELCKLGLE
jgi:hypothetical protein